MIGMNALAFDTHRFVKCLTAAGFTETQAEVLAEEQARLIDERLTTKADLAELEVALKRDIAELEMRMNTCITEVESKLEVRIAEVESKLKHEITLVKRDIAENEARMNTRIAETKADLIKWMLGAVFGAMALQVALIVGLIKLL